jgi:hypothetical protein
MADNDFFDGIDDVSVGRKWEYEEGDQLGGEVIKTFRGEGDYGPYTGYVVAAVLGSTEASQRVTVGEEIIYYVNDNSAAARDLPPGRVHIGDVLKVKYIGKFPSKKQGHQPFKKFNHILVPTAPATAADGQPADW